MIKIKKNNKYLIGLVISVILFILFLFVTIYSIAITSKSSDPGFDLNKYSVTKLVDYSDGYKIIGTQEGKIIGITQDGHEDFNSGVIYENSIYDVAVFKEKIYAVFANGIIVSFNIKDAKDFKGENFKEICKEYKSDYVFNTNGNVKNTQLVFNVNSNNFLLRGVFNDSSKINRIYSFNIETAEKIQIEATSNILSGAVIADDGTIFYTMKSSVYKKEGNYAKVEVANINETLGALSLNGNKISVITTQNKLYNLNIKEDKNLQTYNLGIILDSNYIFSTGSNFIAKIKNGGIAYINGENGKVEMTVKGSDSDNLVMWSDQGFILRRDVDEKVDFAFYSMDYAKKIQIFSKLKIILIVLDIITFILALYFTFSVNEKYRKKINHKFILFFLAIKNSKWVYVSLIVPFTLLILFYYIPIILNFNVAFLDYLPGEKSVFIGIKNFESVFNNIDFWKSSLTMLIFLIADLIKAIIPPLFLAEAIKAVKYNRFSMIVRILLFLPGVLPGVAITLVWSAGIFGSSANSLVNAFIDLFVPGFVKNWVYSSSNSVAIGTLIAFGFPWIGAYLIFFGALGGINESIYESAKLDGCTWVKRMFCIDIPLIVPQIKYIFITSFIASVQNYTSIYILHGINGQIKTPALLMYREIMSANYGVASAMGIIIFAFLCIATFLNFKMQSKEE